MTEHINGAAVIADQQPNPNRGTCQQCRFGQISLNAGQLTLVCKRLPPTPVGTIIQVQQDTVSGPQIVQQWAANAFFPSVGKDDWCGEWQQDPNAIRSGEKSVIAQASDRAS